MQNIKRLKKQFVTQQDHIFSGRVRPGTGFNMVTNLFGGVLRVITVITINKNKSVPVTYHDSM